MIPCVVIRDLLLLYEAGECSEETARMIEEHLEKCEECRLELEKLGKPLDIEQEEIISSEGKVKEINAKRAFGKIKRRWIASIVIVVMIFPTIMLGRFTHNEIKKDGVCFSNLDDLYRCNNFLKAIQNKDYEEAFTYFNVEAQYELIMRNYGDMGEVSIDDEWTEEQQKQFIAFVEYYKDMGLETYIEHEKKYFLDNMKKFDVEEFKIKSYHLQPYYYYNEKNRQWSITVTLDLYKENESCAKVYKYEGEEDEIRKDFMVDSSSRGITLDSGWLDRKDANDFRRGVSYMGIVEDVDNFYGY